MAQRMRSISRPGMAEIGDAEPALPLEAQHGIGTVCNETAVVLLDHTNTGVMSGGHNMRMLQPMATGSTALRNSCLGDVQARV